LTQTIVPRTVASCCSRSPLLSETPLTSFKAASGLTVEGAADAMSGKDGGRFAGRTVMVTGAANGIGAAIARRFASEGAPLAAVDVDGPGLDLLVRAIEEAGGRAIGLVADVRDAASVGAAVEGANSEFGSIDVLVNNAGVVRYGELPDVDEADWDFVIDTNLKGQFLVSRAVVPHMRRAGGGVILNVASVQAFASQRLVAAYAASKGGIVALTRTMALDHMKDRIRVNCICPGAVLTPMQRYAADLFAPEDPDAAIASWGSSQIEGPINPASIAAVASFLASDESSSTTGAVFVIDGGLSARLAI
jgi:NAD(P)-dependent dehydrogenase (short-subunit alcohol dehydrogenase family)